KRNFCVEQSNGDIIIPLDDDDIILPEYIDFCIRKIENYNWYLSLNTFIYNKDENKLKVNSSILPNLLIFRKELWEKVKYKNISFDENGELLKDFYKQK